MSQFHKYIEHDHPGGCALNRTVVDRKVWFSLGHKY